MKLLGFSIDGFTNQRNSKSNELSPNSKVLSSAQRMLKKIRHPFITLYNIEVRTKKYDFSYFLLEYVY